MLNTLVNRANTIFAAMGGYRAAQGLFSDQDLTEICLFNGPTFIVTPWVQSWSQYRESVGNSEASLPGQDGLILPVPVIPLESLGWVEGKQYTVMNKDLQTLYRVSPQPLRYGDPLDLQDLYCWGRASQDISLLLNSREGELFYLLVSTEKDPTLVQLIVSQSLPRQDVETAAMEWAWSSKSAEVLASGLTLTVDTEGVSTSVFLSRGSRPEITEENMVYAETTERRDFIGINSITLELPGTGICCFRMYEVAGGSITIGQPYGATIQNLALTGYKQVRTEESKTVWYKDSEEIHLRESLGLVSEVNYFTVTNQTLQFSRKASLTLKNKNTLGKDFYEWQGVTRVSINATLQST